MKVRFDKNILSHALDMVQRAAQNKITSNTNNGILIIAKDNKVTLQANDYTIGIKTTCDAIVEEEGDVVIASPQMPGMIRLLPGNEVIMENDHRDTLCHFKAGNRQHSIRCWSYNPPSVARHRQSLLSILRACYSP